MYRGKYLRFSNSITRTFVLLSALTANSVKADEYDPFNIYIAQGFQRDNNLFRLPDGAHPANGNGQRDDLVSITTLSGRVNKTYSLQHVFAELAAAHYAYKEYDYLDETVTNGTLGWNWALGKRWSGLISG